MMGERCDYEHDTLLGEWRLDSGEDRIAYVDLKWEEFVYTILDKESFHFTFCGFVKGIGKILMDSDFRLIAIWPPGPIYRVRPRWTRQEKLL